MSSKLKTMKEAVKELIRDGNSIAIGTALETAIPFSAGYEIIRQGRKNLTLIGPISDILFDILIGAGCVGKIKAAWVGNVITGSGYNFRRGIEKGFPNKIRIYDHSNFTISLALHAKALGIPYIPAKCALGSDFFKTNPELVISESPFNNEKLALIKAVEPDITIVTVPRCDEEGNCHLWGNLGVTIDAAFAAKKVIVVAEDIVSKRVIQSDPSRTLIPSLIVSAVVHEPFGAHPSPVPGCYNRDHKFYTDYSSESKSIEGFRKWLDEWVYSTPLRYDYLKRVGPKRIAGLKIRKNRWSKPVNYGF